MHDLLLEAAIVVGWLLLFVAAIFILAYRRASLAASTGVLLLLLAARWALGSAPMWWKVAVSVPFALLLLFNVRALRIRLLTRPFMKKYLKLLPAMSATEREALAAGTVWWDGELFTRNASVSMASRPAASLRWTCRGKSRRPHRSASSARPKPRYYRITTLRFRASLMLTTSHRMNWAWERTRKHERH